MAHKKTATKVLDVSRKWERLKTGLFGYKVSRKVSWSCGNLTFNGGVKSDSCVREAFGGKNLTVGCGGLLGGNFTVKGEAGVKRSAEENSLEPRYKRLKTSCEGF